MCTNLTIQLFGTPNIIVDSKDVALRSKRSFALIAYLHLKDKPVSRKDIAELLWGSNEQPASGNLRVLLYQLRKLLLNSIVDIEKTLTIDKTIQLDSDVNRFLALYNEASITSYQAAIKTYGGDFLANNSFEASAKYTAWLEEQQVNFRRKLDIMYLEVLEFLLTKGKRASDLKEAVILTERYNALFPWSDNMMLKLVLVHIKQRQTNKALALLTDYEYQMQKELSLTLPQELAVVKNNLATNQLENITVQYPQYFS